MNRLARRLILATAIVLLARGSNLFAAPDGEKFALTGMAVDASGAALPGVTVTVKPAGQQSDAKEQVTDGAGFAETVVVRAQPDRVLLLTTPIGEAVIEQKVLSDVPLANERFEDALPLLPGVVRGPDGLLNMNGARADQSSYLMNGVNMTDPVSRKSIASAGAARNATWRAILRRRSG